MPPEKVSIISSRDEGTGSPSNLSPAGASTFRSTWDAKVSKFLWPCAITSLIGLVVFVYTLISTRQSALDVRSTYEARITLQASLIERGSIWLREVIPLHFKITNSIETDLEVVGFDTGCSSCVSIEPNHFTLPKGGEQQIVVTFKPQTGRMKHIDNIQSRIEVFVRPRVRIIKTQEEAVCRPINLSVVVTRVIDIEPILECGEYSEKQDTIPTTERVFRTAESIRGLVLHSAPKHWSVDLMHLGGLQYRLRLRPPMGRAGPMIEDELRLRATTEQGEEIDHLVRLRHHVLSDIQLSPTMVVLGGQLIGVETRSRITVSSLTGIPIQRVTLSPTRASIRGEQVAGNPAAIDLVIRVDHTGDQTHNIVVEIATPQGYTQVPVVIRFTGIAE